MGAGTLPYGLSCALKGKPAVFTCPGQKFALASVVFCAQPRHGGPGRESCQRCSVTCFV